jgi:hypothetical protein
MREKKPRDLFLPENGNFGVVFFSEKEQKVGG